MQAGSQDSLGSELAAFVTQPRREDVPARVRHVSEREGSRVKIEINRQQWRCHRPHPGKEAMRYQVEEARELLELAGALP